MDLSAGFGALLSFAAVIAMIPLALWLLRRTPMGRNASSAGMRTVAALPLSNTQRIVTVEVGTGDERRWLVLGVTPGSISTLHTMAPQEDAPLPAAGNATPFAQVLGRLQGRGSRDAH
ncbi:flagellar biogenesis protein [Rubrivivax gelatinosus]|uniref:Flagellar biogenesis protein n=1 Tax=Rubrivivax gelatinosus TaxID=28068 RepID=A0ABS1DYK9_RUBGE|nr:flagellar biogenesis protein [Rubrivivax gelatinosus]MBK1714226.1 flagellar biogenesis protein [Rubrivivax gelatinosus]